MLSELFAKKESKCQKCLQIRKRKGGLRAFVFKNVIGYKRMDQWSVLLVSTALESMDDVSSVQMREKGSATKSVISCPNVLKLYNNGMGEVDLMDQRTAAYWLD